MPVSFIRAFALLMLLSGPAAIPAQAAATGGDEPAGVAQEDIAGLESKAAKARQEEDWSALYAASSGLHRQRPFEPAYMLDIIRAAGGLGQRQTVYTFMLKLQQAGLSYDIGQIPQTAFMSDTEAFQYINKLLVEAGQPAGEGESVLSIAGRPADIGDLAWDPTRERFLLGTRSDGRLLAMADDGSTELLLQADDKNGLWSIEGLAVDAKNGVLWIASSASPAFARYSPADARRGALFRFDLATLELRDQYNLPIDGLPHSLGSVALTDTGDVYVVDRAVPIVFRKAAGDDRLEHFVGMPRLVALTDLAVTPDNSRLFVADAVMGIMVIDPKAGGARMLQGPENLNLYGIYGLEYVDGALVITQSGISPQRIMRLELDAVGAAAENVTPMAVALQGFDTPGTGTLRGDRIYYFANHGTATDDDRMRLMVTPLNAGVEVKPPDMRLFERALRGRVQQEQQNGPQQDPQ